MTVDRIDIICDGPHRARGKVAKIVSFAFDADLGEWLGPFHLSRGRLVPARPRGYRADDAEFSAPFRPNVVGSRGATPQRYPCPFCSQKLECSDDTLRWLLNTVAGRGESIVTVSLKQLNVLVSKRAQF
jgi:hypothetical protein